MIIESVVRAAEPFLLGRKIVDAVIGISLVAVSLDDGNVGISYVLREDLDPGCSNFPYVSEAIGEDAEKIARWAVSGTDSLQKTIGVAVLTAASASQDLRDSATPDAPFGVSMRPADRVGMIGSIGSVVRMIRPLVGAVHIFDKGLAAGGDGDILPMEEQPRILSTCDVVMITGTSVINGSVDGLLDMCSHARDIVMIGPSTPMFPAAFKGTKVSVLAGSWWRKENKDRIFRDISLASGVPGLQHSAVKKTVAVKP